MFKIGKTYRITMIGDGPEDSFKGQLLACEIPLICIEIGMGERIINVNSPSFVRADRHDDATLAERHDRQDAIGRGSD